MFVMAQMVTSHCGMDHNYFIHFATDGYLGVSYLMLERSGVSRILAGFVTDTHMHFWLVQSWLELLAHGHCLCSGQDCIIPGSALLPVWHV